jgi:hypothetical protein
MTAEHAGEIMWTYSSPDLYELLVFHRRWSPQEYGAFVADAMIAALLPPQPLAGRADERHDRLRLACSPARVNWLN